MASRRWFLIVAAVVALTPLTAQTLPGTQPLETKGDLARLMVGGIGKYLDRELTASVKKRQDHWKLDYSSLENYEASIKPNRERFKKLIGLVDKRLPPRLDYVATAEQPALIAQTDLYKVYTVRWQVLPGVDGEGLLLQPTGKIKACVVAIPDADWPPEVIVGLTKKLELHPKSQFARQLAEQGCQVIVPTLIDRQDTYSGSPVLNRWTNQTHREFIYRMSYEMGRHIIGYEVHKVLAAVDWFARTKDHPPIGVFGYGEGGLLAYYSAAVDTRIEATVVSGFFTAREKLFEEPIYRNVWGLLNEFGDGELIHLVTPRRLIIEHSRFKANPPPLARAGRSGAAPGTLGSPGFAGVLAELDRVIGLIPKNEKFPRQKGSFVVGLEFGGTGLGTTLEEFSASLGDAKFVDADAKPPVELRKSFDPEPRQKRQFDQLVDYTQKMLPDAARKRQDFFWKLDTSSVDKYDKSTKPLRDHFRKEIIGALPEPTLPMNPRTRLLYDTPKFKGYEVVLDLYEDVICYGILLVPNDIKPGEKRPVVVCQHGLEGRPVDVCNPDKKTTYYNSFGADLANKGYVVFAPQNPYIFGNTFRQLVAGKGHPLKISLYSFIYRQHERILDFLGTLPYVDTTKIAFYGLSYGGKVAMRICALLERYCLAICSGDFNEWIWKNITLDWGGSYMFTTEYDMYEFDLGNTFNYAEMAGLIAPRPFMVERGHNDGVGLDEYVAFEYAKVRRLYAKLGLSNRTEIEFFQGGHEIHGQRTYAFLQRHLNWPAK